MPHILLVEDSGMHVELIRDALLTWDPSVELSVVSTLAEARSRLIVTTPDLALIDLMLPDGRGTELFPEDRNQVKFPALLLTGSGDERVAVKAMKAGALDYLVKSSETLAELPYIIDRTLREWKHIVQRRQAEEAFRRSEAKYRGLFENMGDAMAVDQLICDEEGRPVDWVITAINPAYVEIFGIPQERAIGSRASALYGTVMDLQPLLQGYGAVAEGGDPVQLELYFPPTQKYLLVSVFTLGEGTFATLSKDVSEHRRMETEREQLMAKLEATINAIADAVIIYDTAGEIRKLNPAARQLFGYGPDEWDPPLDRRLARFDIRYPDGSPFPFLETMLRVVEGEVLCGIVAVLHRADGRKVWLSNSAAPIVTAEGERVGAVATATDITALHELQLQHEIYVHTISHDLRTPLTTIQGYAELLADGVRGGGGDSVSLLEMCEELQKGVGRMARLIDDLVDTARLEGGQLLLDTSAMDLGSFLEGLAERSLGVVDPRRLLLEIAEGLPPVLADPDRLDRILLNLLSNAMKYSAAGSPVRLQVRCRQGMVEVLVRDQGRGLAAEDQPHIFERFYCPRGSRRSDRVGLGLYITRMLVEAHGGTIRVDSQVGVGTTFTFTLPPA